MLSRTADNLYWLARYVERAEYLARILDTTLRLNTLPLSYGGDTNEWESAVASAGCVNAFFAVHDEANEETVIDFLAFSTSNPSSIRNCFEIARLNARAVRTALTTEMWDSINGIWLELRNWNKGPSTREELARFLRWVTESSLRFDGSAYRTMLRNDAYCFSRIGVYLERADNTARILDVKYHLLLPPVANVGGPLDYFQWASILRSVSALTAYHWVYRQNVKPWLVAELLMLKDEMPRSLASCYENLVQNLDHIATAYGRRGPAQRQALTVRARLMNSRIEEIFQSGLHEFIMPARYIAGYLQLADGRVDQEAGHAWAEAFIPEIGWVGFDPANGVCPTEAYVRVAVGLDSIGAAPVRGTRFGPGSENLEVAIKVGQ